MQIKVQSLLRSDAFGVGKGFGAIRGKTIAVRNPANLHPVGSIPDMGAAETKAAIEAANRAWPAWRAKTAKERSAILRKWFNLMLEN
ncbi:MAG: aldehyde dehydrogenase family protein, partial [Alphaproteobacteria bacterium]